MLVLLLPFGDASSWETEEIEDKLFSFYVLTVAFLFHFLMNQGPVLLVLVYEL